MAGIVVQKNIGGVVTLRDGSQALSWTAAGSGDNTTKNGLAIDRQGLSSGSPPLSMLAGVLYDATLGSGNTLSVQIDVQDSADNSTFADFATESAVTVATGASGGGRVQGQHVLAVDLTNARRYVRVNFLPDLSAGGTDTAVAQSVAVLAGFDRLASPA